MTTRCNHIEEAYEFMLGYAAQGLSSDAGSNAGSQVRGFLSRLDAALDGLAEVFTAVVAAEQPPGADQFRAFIGVLERDAHAAQAAVRLVLAQPAISSQFVDNLNGLTHLRALLRDIFLVDEILKGQRLAASGEAGLSVTSPDRTGTPDS